MRIPVFSATLLFLFQGISAASGQGLEPDVPVGATVRFQSGGRVGSGVVDSIWVDGLRIRGTGSEQERTLPFSDLDWLMVRQGASGRPGIGAIVGGALGGILSAGVVGAWTGGYGEGGASWTVLGFAFLAGMAPGVFVGGVIGEAFRREDWVSVRLPGRTDPDPHGSGYTGAGPNTAYGPEDPCSGSMGCMGGGWRNALAFDAPRRARK